jgi:Tfp pilus assembly protein PilW
MNRGMSLIEAAVWVAVFVSAMLALASSILYFYRTNNYALQQASATTSAQHGIDLMIRTIREATYASDGSYPIASIAANDFKFYAKINSNPGIEEIHFYLSGTNLIEGVITPTGDPAVYTGTEATSTLSSYVRNVAQGTSLFSYYDKNGNQIVDYTKVGDVRFVTANLWIDVDTSKAPVALNLRTSAALRNLVGK